MPKKDGREALKEIKSDPDLKGIPIVVLTTSKAEEDIYRTYNLGVNSFITKPVTFDSLVSITRDLGRYWFEIVELPQERKQRSNDLSTVRFAFCSSTTTKTIIFMLRELLTEVHGSKLNLTWASSYDDGKKALLRSDSQSAF